VPEAQRRVYDLIESSLTALRIDVHSALNTNAKIITDWKELVDRFGPGFVRRSYQDRKGAEVGFARETRGSNLRG